MVLKAPAVVAKARRDGEESTAALRRSTWLAIIAVFANEYDLMLERFVDVEGVMVIRDAFVRIDGEPLSGGPQPQGR